MSTNYFAKIHLGKTSSHGKGNPLLYIQATQIPEGADVVIETDTGETMTPDELRRRMDEWDFDYDHIGEVFR